MNQIRPLQFSPVPGTLQWKDSLVTGTLILVLVNIFLLSLRKLRKNGSSNGGGGANDKPEDSTSLYQAYHSLPGPRPFPIRFIGNGLNFFPFNKAELLDKLLGLCQEYGSCFRLTCLNEDYVVLNSGAYVQALLTSNDSAHWGKGGLEAKLWPEGIHGLVTYTGDEWRTRRKMLNRSFTYKSLQRYNTCFNKQSQKLITELEELFSDGEVHDVDKLVKTCIFRQSSETLMGVDLSDSEDGAKFCESTDVALDATFERIYRPWLYPNWIWRLHPLYRKQRSCLREMGRVASKIITSQKERMTMGSTLDRTDVNENSVYENQDYDNMVEAMLRNGVPDEQIFHEVAIMLAVAYDTTSVSVLFSLFLLALHPEHQKLCREEVDAIFNDPSLCKDGFLQFDALSEMKYLERCLLEAQRIHPVATVMRKLETPLRLSDDLVIPAGVTPFYIGYFLHMNPEYFPDPLKFDPDRFLPDEVRKRHPYAYAPFSGGPRSCIGTKLAIIEMKIIFAKILHNFEISTPDKRENLKVLLNGIPKPAKPIRFLFTKRKHI